MYLWQPQWYWKGGANECLNKHRAEASVELVLSCRCCCCWWWCCCCCCCYDWYGYLLQLLLQQPSPPAQFHNTVSMIMSNPQFVRANRTKRFWQMLYDGNNANDDDTCFFEEKKSSIIIMNCEYVFFNVCGNEFAPPTNWALTQKLANALWFHGHGQRLYSPKTTPFSII